MAIGVDVLIVSSRSSEPGGTEAVGEGIASVIGRFGWTSALAVVDPNGNVVDDTGAKEWAACLSQSPQVSRDGFFSLYREDRGFNKLLIRKRPALVQFHGLSAHGANLYHVIAAKQSGARVVVWHNVPGVTCLQRGLLRGGSVPCDGEIKVGRCTRCRLRAHQLKELPLPRLLATVASAVSVNPAHTWVPGRLGGLIGARHSTARFHDAWKDLNRHVDVFRVGANWARRVLACNGVGDDRLVLIRPGCGEQFLDAAEGPDTWWSTSSNLKIVYWGRIHRSKGVHTLLEAVARLRGRALDVVVAGDWSGADDGLMRLRRAAEESVRLRCPGAVRGCDLVSLLRGADVAVIPSRWFETGPLTVFEARACNLPIVGSRRGGIEELCENDASALLLEPEDPNALAMALAGLDADRVRLAAMRASAPRARTMTDVGADVDRLYRRVLG